jgi:lipid A 4'-phosphatase
MTPSAIDLREHPGRWALGIFFIFMIVPGLTLPSVDLNLSGLFYVPGTGFTWSADGFLEFVRVAAPDIIVCSFATCVFLWIVGRVNAQWQWVISTPHMIYLFLTLLIGPVLIVEGLLKPFWGRARPKDIELFGGEQIYTLPWQIANECMHNCSFVSGHVAMAFWLTAYAYLLPPKWRGSAMIAGIFLGLGMGVVRVAQGAHFPSDVIASGFVVLLVNEVLAGVFLQRRVV